MESSTTKTRSYWTMSGDWNEGKFVKSGNNDILAHVDAGVDHRVAVIDTFPDKLEILTS